MSRLLTMDIAGMVIALQGDRSMVVEEPYPLVRPFFQERRDRHPAAIDLALRTDGKGPKDHDAFALLFDSGQAWSLWQGENRRLFRFQPPQMTAPMWQAVVNPEVTAGTVFVGQDLVRVRQGRKVVTNPLNYPLDQLLVMYHLASRDGIVVHAAGAVVNGAGYLFPGVSGAGKSTLARLLAAAGHTMLSDDRIVVRRTDSGHVIWGTPWPGDAAMAINASAPLAGVFFLHQDRAGRLASMAPGKAVERLMPVTSIPWYDAETVCHALDRCDALVAEVPAHDFHFPPTPEAVRTLETFGGMGS